MLLRNLTDAPLEYQFDGQMYELRPGDTSVDRSRAFHVLAQHPTSVVRVHADWSANQPCEAFVGHNVMSDLCIHCGWRQAAHGGPQAPVDTAGVVADVATQDAAVDATAQDVASDDGLAPAATTDDRTT